MAATTGGRRPVLGRVLLAREPGRRRTTEYNAILGIVLVLSLFGLLMVLSASSVTALYEHGNSWYETIRQAGWFVLAVLALWVTQRVDHAFLRRYARAGFVAAMALLVLPLLPVIGIEVNGSSRWFGYGMFRIQPSELAKLAMIVFVARVLTDRADTMRDWRAVLKPILGAVAVFALLLMLEPNLGTTMIVVAIVLLMLFVGGLPTGPLIGLVVTFVMLASVAAFRVSWRFKRLLSYTDPWSDPLGTGLQSIQSRVGIATGGLRGVGLGNSRVKWLFLPEADTDFIFAIVGEELGLLGCLTVIALLLGLGWFGIRTAMRATDRFGMLLATGITSWILLQAFVNIGAVVGLLPITGVPLPFVSAGGSSLIFTMAAVGVLLSVANRET